jgi:hypothetical protein
VSDILVYAIIFFVVCLLDAMAYVSIRHRYVANAPHSNGYWSAGYIPRCREQWLARIPLGAIVMYFTYHPEKTEKAP